MQDDGMSYDSDDRGYDTITATETDPDQPGDIEDALRTTMTVRSQPN
jgi:hypothetical protein